MKNNVFNIDEMIPVNANFEFLDVSDREMISSAYNVIHKLEGWQKLQTFRDGSFMFCIDGKIKNIMSAVADNYGLHSGSSLGLTMRIMEYIAKNGFEQFKKLYQ